MSVTKANITTLAQYLCQSKANATTFADYFDKVSDELARWPKPPQVATATFNIVSATAAYSFQTAAVEVLAVFAKERELSLQSISDLEVYSKTWQTDTGDPYAYTFEDQLSRKYLMYPIPDENDTNGGRELYSQSPTSGIVEWLSLPLAFLTMAQEFTYPSDHQDKEFADNCKVLGDLLLRILGH